MLADPMTSRSASCRSQIEFSTFVATVLMLVVSPVFGVDIELSKQLSTRLTYSDNLNRSDDRKSGGFIWEVVPGFVLNAKGRRLNADIAYAAQTSYETGEDSGGRLDHRLQANVGSELYEDHVFLDLAVTGRQELIDSFAPGAFDTAGYNNNQQTTWTYRVNPSYRQRFGRYSDLRLDLETNGVLYSETQDDESQGYVAKGRLTSGGFWEPAFFELRTRYEEEQYRSTGSSRFANLQNDAGYRVDRRWRFLASAGYEDNDYLSFEDTSGPIWGLGLDWTPTARTQLVSRAEHHYYGWAPRIELSHRSRMSRLTARYAKEIETERARGLRQEVYRFKDAFGESIVPELGTDPGASSMRSISTSTAYVLQRLALEYTLQTRRSTVSLGADYETYDYELSGADEEVAECHFSWTRSLSRDASANLLLRWSDRTRGTGTATTGEDVAVDEYAIDLGLRRKLSDHMSTSLNYGFRDYDDGAENRVTVSIGLNW